MNEAETRAELIDPKLKAFGWGVAEGELDSISTVANFTTVQNEGGKKAIAVKL